jgi:hypothetical protein
VQDPPLAPAAALAPPTDPLPPLLPAVPDPLPPLFSSERCSLFQESILVYFCGFDFFFFFFGALRRFGAEQQRGLACADGVFF